jgi:enoyl-CoA hydratase
MSYEMITVEQRDAVTLVTLNRPKALNALCRQLIAELAAACAAYDADDSQRCMVLTGSDRAFAAGADIKEMKDKTLQEAFAENFIGLMDWERVTLCRKPVIAAVAGYALGGGCELAMMCDFIIAAETAKFGQPEITIGTIPGAGGSQRLTRSVGKSKAMDLVLTGRMMEAAEAERCGLVSRLVPADRLLDEALEAAAKIASFSRPVVMMAKEAVSRAFETPLSEGLRAEKRLFHATFGLEDQKEGMAAFAEKRPPRFAHR